MMNEQDFIVQADRFLNGEMDSSERIAFERYCEGNPAAAEQLATHRLFLQQLKHHADRAAFKSTLAVVADRYHRPDTTVAEGRWEPMLVALWNRFKVNSLVAASVAIVAVFSTLWLSGYYKTIEKTTTNYSALRRDMNTVKQNVNAQNAVIRNINNEKQKEGQSEGHFGATGFIISPNGYVVTNYHVVKDADSVHLQNTKGESLRADVIYIDPTNDLAMLHISDSAFSPLKTTPYTFKEADSDLGEDVYTIGFPRDEVVYGQGYLSSRTGYAGDTTAYQLSIPVNPGNSGGPVIDSRGQVIGIISGKQTGIDGASFAIKAEALLKSISAIPMDSLASKLTINRKNSLNGLKRTDQIKKIQEYVYLVKVY
ncbi:S1 family peptidase [Parapedobacter indicus]|uniref:Trypsin-like peptidase domain-containing protein n=1 Tax=Parapedobacter indicus TaxID=1477437 RepID=A0A1I3MAY2_9SPHI|nr:serine protease [Parapedobacter indicus]PPL01225.1 trypsin-like peptidase [Parapedobacter indicus]SFI94097.1 Trypsin-like peptidase domain-containing protein [Parapedobacter indicus]